MDNILLILYVFFVLFILGIIAAIIVIYVRNHYIDNTEKISSGSISTGDTYISPSFDIINYKHCVVQISSNRLTEDIIDIQVSPNNTDWINAGLTLSPITTGVESSYFINDNLFANYFRVKFTNTGASGISLTIFVTKKNY